MKDIVTKINENTYPCDGGIRGMSQKFDIQLTGHLEKDVNKIMNHLLYTYESYKSDGKGYFDPSQFKREYLYKEFEKFMKENQ